MPDFDKFVFNKNKYTNYKYFELQPKDKSSDSLIYNIVDFGVTYIYFSCFFYEYKNIHNTSTNQ